MPDDGKPRYCLFCGAITHWRCIYYGEVGDTFWELNCKQCGRGIAIDSEVVGAGCGEPDPDLPDDGQEVDRT